MNDPEITDRYPKGLNASEVLREIRVRHGEDAFKYCTVIDVADELKAIFS